MDTAKQSHLAMSNKLPSVASDGSCKVCGNSSPLFDVVDFGKHCSNSNPYQFGLVGVPVYYLRCCHCGFIFTEFFDNWSSDQFQSHIYNEDYCKVDPEYLGSRPKRLASIIIENLSSAPKDMSILDFGSGLGIFATQLVNAGFFNTKTYDPYSDPIKPKGKFQLITCFEVMEHSTTPRKILSEMLSLLQPDGIIIFSTGLQPHHILTERAQWWYIGPRNGHVSIFSDEALALLAQTHSLYYLKGNNFLCFSRNPVLSPIFSTFNFLPFLTYSIGSQSGSPQHWHEIEVSPTLSLQYRWSRTSTLEWTIPFQVPSEFYLKIRIPYVNEVYPGFANQIHLQVNSSHTKMDVKPAGISYLEGLLKCSNVSSPTVIRIVTPATITPEELGRNADKRALGIAVPTVPPS